MVQPLCKTVQRFLKKLKIELPYNPAITLLGIFLKKTKTLIEKDTCTFMFTTALFATSKIWKQSKCPSNRRMDRASLVVQWLRICLPMQGTWVQALVCEDPTFCGATKPVSHNY